MNIKHIIHCAIYGFTAIVLFGISMSLHAADSFAEAKLSAKYTKQRPIIVVSDWEFAPYDFCADDGTPKGYDIDVIHAVLTDMKLPYVNRMAEWKVVVSEFKQKKADLTIEPKNSIEKKGIYFSKMPVEQYRLAVVSHKGSKIIHQFDQLPRDPKRVFFKNSDLGDITAKRQGWPKNDIAYLTTQQALIYTSTHPNTYYIWGYDQLQWAVRKMGATDLQVTLLQDLRPTPLCFASYDPQLIDAIDEAFARLSQDGTIEEIHNKYFNPNRESKETSPFIIVIILFIVAAILAFLVFNFILIRHIRHTSQFMKLYQNVMKLAFTSNHFMVQNYVIKDHTSYNLIGNYFKEGESSKEDFYQRILPADRQKFTDAIQKITEQKSESEGFCYQRIDPESGKVKAFNYCMALGIKDHEGNTVSIVNTIKDITKTVNDRQLQSEATAKFKQIFTRSLIGLALYDKNGCFIEANEEMHRLYQKGLLERDNPQNTNLFVVDVIRKNYDRQSHEPFCYCKIPNKSAKGLEFYAEISITTIFDNKGHIGYYTVSAYDVSEDRNMAMDMRNRERNTRNVRAQLAMHAKQLSDILVRNKAWLYEADFVERVVRMYRQQGHPELTIPIEQYNKLLVDKDDLYHLKKLDEVKHIFDSTDGHQINYNCKCLSPFDSNDSEVHYYAINALPRHNAAGDIIGSYGLFRDVTEYYQIHEHLREETCRANDAGKTKSAFLANMTHEIRTPLNAIVGFSELLRTVKDPKDRQEFIKIIHNNSDMLLRLINDILAVSEMEIGSLEIKLNRVDFVPIFHKISESLRQRVDNPNVRYICDNPCDTLIINIDKDRIQQVITNFLTNAVKYTKIGHIKLGYAHVDNGLRIYCEDTGTGIPEEKQKAIFDRFVKLNDFVQGTGLGLNICKGIAKACGGKIGVDSKPGIGSTFWIWLPMN